jgi:DNA-binding transcriptional ArsR family regulator
MITIHLTPDDLAAMRFAYRPMLEIPMSYRVLKNPALHRLHHRWLEMARAALYGIDLPYLDALIAPGGCYIPDFLLPAPVASETRLEDDLAELLTVPDETIRQHMEVHICTNGDSEMRRFFVAYPREAMHGLVDDLSLYWQHTLAEVWPRMTSLVDGDVLNRARTLALHGADTVFPDLDSTVAYYDRTVRIRRDCQVHPDFEATLNGEGVNLMPSIFSHMCMYRVVPDRPAQLIYGARGTGNWFQANPVSNQSLEMALGAPRAQVLIGLRTPATTTELAFRLHVSAGTVSQQLARLTKAGLVEPHRSGKRVYYHLTERGETLIALFDSSE